MEGFDLHVQVVTHTHNKCVSFNQMYLKGVIVTALEEVHEIFLWSVHSQRWGHSSVIEAAHLRFLDEGNQTWGYPS